MSDAVVRLNDLADPVAFLTGARIPLAHLWPMPFPAVEWIATRILIEGSAGPRFDTIRAETLLMLGLDCAHPDVARWVDSKIATALGLPEHAVLSYGNEWCFWLLGDECPRFIGDLRVGLASAVRGIPRTDANVPLTRAALLRALFGVSNA